MKNLTILLILLAFNTFAQVPKLINYQGVVRNSAGIPLTNKPIGLKFEIRELGPTGPIVYTEQQSTTTNSLGLFSVRIGQNANLGIPNWINTPYSLEVSVDTSGTNNFIFAGSQQLVSVPFALYAEKAGNAITYSPSPNITITGPTNIIDLSTTLTSSISVGYAGPPQSTIPKLEIDIFGRIINAAEYSANDTGDVEGPLFDQTVIGLQGFPVSPQAPSPGQVLQYQVGTGWTPSSPSASVSSGPWAVSSGNIHPSLSSDRVSIGTTFGNSLLNIENVPTSPFTSMPVVNIQNNNPLFNAQGIVNVINSAGGGSGISVQNNNSSAGSYGLNVQMTSSATSADGIYVNTNSGGAYALRAQNSGTGATIFASGTTSASMAQFNNLGTGAGLTVSSGAVQAGLISYNSGSGAAILGYNTSTSSGASSIAHGVGGQTGNPSPLAVGVIGMNTSIGAGVSGINNNTITSSTSAHGIKGETANGAAQASGVFGINYNIGAGVTGISTSAIASGNGHGVYGETNNPSVNSSGVFGKNTSGGNGVFGTTSSNAINAAGVFGENIGQGPAVLGVKNSVGNVAKFENTIGTNNADALIASTKGAGAAVSAVSGTAVTSALSLLLTNGHIKSIGPSVFTGSITVAGGFTPPSFAPILINCTDIKGSVSFSTSVTGLTTGSYIELEILFAKPFAIAPTVMLTPVNDMLGLDYIVRNTTTTGFVIRVYRSSNASASGPTSIPSPATFKFTYFVIE